MCTSTCEVVGQPSFCVVMHVYVIYFVCEFVAGHLSNALLMSSVTRSVLCGGLTELIPL